MKLQENGLLHKKMGIQFHIDVHFFTQAKKYSKCLILLAHDTLIEYLILDLIIIILHLIPEFL